MSLAQPFSNTRHPWLDEFVEFPVKSFGDLLAGYQPRYSKLEAPDTAFILFSTLPATDPAVLALTPAISGWLNQRKQETPPTDYPRLQRWVREICEAFEIVSRLKVKEVA